MRGDNVEILLMCNGDLGEIVDAHPEMKTEIPDLKFTQPGGFQVGTHGSESPNRKSSDPYLQVDPVMSITWNEFEEDEIATLQEIGPFTSCHILESTSADLSARVIVALSSRAEIAIDNDWNGILSGEAFRALDREAQIRFIQAKYDDNDRFDKPESEW